MDTVESDGSFEKKDGGLVSGISTVAARGTESAGKKAEKATRIDTISEFFVMRGVRLPPRPRRRLQPHALVPLVRSG